MQRRFMMLVTMVLLMTAMLVASAAPAMGALVPTGTPLPTVVCEEAADGSGPVGWRGGTCWVFHPTATSLL